MQCPEDVETAQVGCDLRQNLGDNRSFGYWSVVLIFKKVFSIGWTTVFIKLVNNAIS